ncbi:MAG: DUF5683 domain-containing protein, partial [bacterium]
LPFQVAAQKTDNEAVDLAVTLYNDGSFRDAELLCLRILQHSPNLLPVDRIILYRTLGFSYVAMGENEKAKQQFLNWLELDPLAELDSVYISPKIISVFQEAKEDYTLKRKNLNEPQFHELNLQMHALKRSLIFPGLGQLYLGKQIKGTSLAVSEIVLLGTTVFCQLQYSSARDRYLASTNSSEAQDLYKDCNFYYQARNVSAIVAVGIYLYSVFDVMYSPPVNVKKKTFPVTLRITSDQQLSLIIHLD